MFRCTSTEECGLAGQFGEDHEGRKILPVITIQGGKFVATDGISYMKNTPRRGFRENNYR